MPEVFSKKMEEHHGELKHLLTHADSVSLVTLRSFIMLLLALTLAK